MYYGLSKNDLRIILAFSVYLRTGAPAEISVPNSLMVAEQYLNAVEALNAESESSAKRDDGEGEGARA